MHLCDFEGKSVRLQAGDRVVIELKGETIRFVRLGAALNFCTSLLGERSHGDNKLLVPHLDKNYTEIAFLLCHVLGLGVELIHESPESVMFEFTASVPPVS